MPYLGLISLLVFCGLSIHLWWSYRPLFAALVRPTIIREDKPLPKAQVILCVRGRDPFLGRCIQCLTAQTYPNYRISIIVDSPRDEALPDALAALDGHHGDRIDVLVRDHTCDTCTRKLASLTWALQRVANDVEIVAQCDGDAVVHPEWLTELVDGLDDPSVAAVSGNRWYVSTSGGFAAASRYYWNAMALPWMNHLGIPWAGSFAMKSCVYRDPSYIRFLQHSFSDDTATAAFMRSKQLSFKTLPKLLVINEEGISLQSFWGFLVRQLLAVRLQHAGWPYIATHALTLVVGTWALGLACALAGQKELFAWVIGNAIFVMTMLSLIARYEVALGRTLGHKRIAFRRRSNPGSVASLIGLACIGCIYPGAILTAQFTRIHEWRGIRYRIGRKKVIAIGEREFRMEVPKPVRPI